MKHLQFLENELEYNEEIAIDGYAELPLVVAFPEDDNIKTKYLKAPNNKIICQGNDQFIFGNDQNIKRVWIDDELVFSNDNKREWHEVRITSGLELTKSIPLDSMPLIEISLDEEYGPITENDEFYYIIYNSAGMASWFGGLIHQLSGLKIINGKLNIEPFIDCEGFLGASGRSVIYFRVARNSVDLNMNVRWYGCKSSNAEVVIRNNNQENLQPLPSGLIEYIEISSNAEINRDTDGLLIMDTLTQELDFMPVYMLEEHFSFNGFPFIMQLNNESPNMALVWCRIKFVNDDVDSGEVESIECFDTEIKVYLSQNVANLKIPVDTTATVTYERYNRFFPVSFNSSSIAFINDDCFKYTTTIWENNFKNCQNLTNIIIPNGIKNIRQEAFINCTNLTSITLPKTLESISNDIFENCTSLREIVCLCPITLLSGLQLPSNDGILKLPQGVDYSVISDKLIKKNWIVEYI